MVALGISCGGCVSPFRFVLERKAVERVIAIGCECFAALRNTLASCGDFIFRGLCQAGRHRESSGLANLERASIQACGDGARLCDGASCAGYFEIKGKCMGRNARRLFAYEEN